MKLYGEFLSMLSELRLAISWAVLVSQRIVFIKEAAGCAMLCW
jgi:hypothetical protein